MATLLTLPDEVLLDVLRYLPPSTLATSAQVCRRLARLARENTLWQRLCHARGYHALAGYEAAHAERSFRASAQLQAVTLLNDDNVSAAWAVAVVDHAINVPMTFALTLIVRAHFCGSATIFVGHVAARHVRSPPACRNVLRRRERIQSRQAARIRLADLAEPGPRRLPFHVVMALDVFLALPPAALDGLAHATTPDTFLRFTSYRTQVKTADPWISRGAQRLVVFEGAWADCHAVAQVLRRHARALPTPKDQEADGPTAAVEVLSPQLYRNGRSRLAAAPGGSPASRLDRWLFARTVRQGQRDNERNHATVLEQLEDGMEEAVNDDVMLILDLDDDDDDDDANADADAGGDADDGRRERGVAQDAAERGPLA